MDDYALSPGADDLSSHLFTRFMNELSSSVQTAFLAHAPPVNQLDG